MQLFIYCGWCFLLLLLLNRKITLGRQRLGSRESIIIRSERELSFLFIHFPIHTNTPNHHHHHHHICSVFNHQLINTVNSLGINVMNYEIIQVENTRHNRVCVNANHQLEKWINGKTKLIEFIISLEFLSFFLVSMVFSVIVCGDGGCIFRSLKKNGFKKTLFTFFHLTNTGGDRDCDSDCC